MTERFGKTTTTDEVLSGIDLTGKRILVTGVSSCLGLETARALVARGAHVVGAVRDVDGAEEATGEIRRAAVDNGGAFRLIEIDLGSLADVRECADALLARGEPLDVAIANAGVMATPFEHTVDGFERQFATNHLGHFVLVNRIAPLIRDGGRLVVLSTVGHQQSDTDLDDPNFDHPPYEPFLASARSKTAVIQFAVEFDRRHSGRGIRAAAVHPGGIATNVGRHLEPAVLQELLAGMTAALASEGRELEMKTVAQAVWAAIAASGDEVGGRYCEDCHVSTVIPNDAQVGVLAEGVRAYALNPARATTLWSKSEELVAEEFRAAA